MPDLTKWIETLDEMREYLVAQASQSNNVIEAVLEREDEVLVEEPEPELVLEGSELEQLQTLLRSSHWPEAVPGDLICDQASDADKIERAEGILDLMVPTLKDRSFLDFGCGEGHVAAEARKRTDKSVVGFDITPQGDLWNDSQILTTNFAKVVEKGPYDVILIYDVIDHMACEVPKMVEQLKEVLAPEGKIYLRAHSWCSRHGAHLYHQINRAFVHLVFTRDELEQMGYDLELYPTRKVIYPVATYRQMFSDFEIENISQNKQPVEEFFTKNMMVRNRIQKSWDTGKFPQYQMEQSFVDMVLSFPAPVEEKEEEEKVEEAKPSEVDLTELVKSDEWPAAIHPSLICDSTEEDKLERAKGIVELLIDEELLDKKLLDFGCGEGHTTSAASEAALAVGYDFQSHENWESLGKENVVFTSNMEEVAEKGPYDIILLFDVIDHLVDDEPVEILKKAKELLTDEGKIYIRCHPFTSKHATHIYRQLNKAYIHLVFSDEELQELIPDYKPEVSNQVVRPIAQYKDFVNKAELKIVDRRDIVEKVGDFFSRPVVANKIKEKTGFNDLPTHQMSMQFIDFTLSK